MTARDIAALFDALELDLVKSLHRCLARHQQQEQTEGGQNGTPRHWQAWQAAKLRDLRRFRRENTAILGEYRDRIDADTRTLLEEEAVQGGSDGFFRMSDERMTALLNEMQQANEQSERAALRYMNDMYRKTILRTAVAMQAGGQPLQQATDAATRDFLDQGIACIRYRNGRRVNISTYAEMALRTAGTRAMLMGEAAQRERLGLDTVLVSQYGACSKTCLPWQGLVYIDDVFQPYHGPRTPGGTYGISRNGRQYPLLSVAMQGGLFHPNCRHTLSTWVEGVSTRPRPMDKAKVEAAAQLEAKQRALERSVRKAKRQAAGLCDPAAAKAARARVRAAQKALRDFVADHGDVLRRNVWRERDTAALERYTTPAASGILDTSNRIGVNPDVNYICDLNPEIYKAAVPTITTEHVIITDKQLEHIRERHPDISATVMEQLTEIIHAPDYIIETDMPYTANILKHLEINGKGYQLVLRIRTDSDPEEFQNSVITFMSVNEKRYRQYLRNRKILYSRE
ncbi:phage minor capsid protein [Gemmiger sp.]|uniref:phage minor capsid protein n=1 Tax=Gemmiger sp. TaxID=2049027 RepID=UPI003A94723E